MAAGSRHWPPRLGSDADGPRTLLRSASSSISNNMVGDALWYQPQLFALVTLDYKCDVAVSVYCANTTQCDMQNKHESMQKTLNVSI